MPFERLHTVARTLHGTWGPLVIAFAMRIMGMRVYLSRDAARSIAAIVLPVASAVLLACSGSGAPTSPETVTGTHELGTLRQSVAVASDCPPNSICQSIEVTCPGVTGVAPAVVAVASPEGAPRGVVLFTSGAAGTGWALRSGDRQLLFDDLLADGFKVVQLAWATNWLESSPGNDAGTARLGCRPATVVKWVHETHFLPLGIARSSTGRCGFCITGNSGGASQSSYPLSHYDLESILDAVIPTGGPPHAALSKACLRKPGEEAYWFPDDTRHFIDRGFGFFDGDGPCFRSDPSFTERWIEASIATGGIDYEHPRTRLHFLVGENDRGMQGPASDYVARLRSGGSPWVTHEIVPNTGHSTTNTTEGRAALRAAILASQ